MGTKQLTPLIVMALIGSIRVASAQTITVDIAGDVIDVDPGTATTAALPGPDGHISFSEAMIAANNTPGRQTIGFAIPTSEWTYLSWYYPGRAVVHTVGGFYWRASDAVTIDGRTQTAFTGDTNPNGREVVLFGTVIYLNADNCTVLGLDSSSVSVTSSYGRIEGNTEMGIELFGGSGSLVQDNTGGYIQIDRSSNNVVVGNTVQRVRVLGWIGNNQPATNNRIGGPTPADRNYITGSGTWNSQGWPSGYAVQLFNAVGTILENNSIGTTPDGLQPGHAATIMGIWFDDENHDTTIRGNRIAGILGHRIGPYPGVLGTAIAIDGFGSGVAIVGNTVGLDAHGVPSLGSVTGIGTSNYHLGPVQNIVIGGPAAGEGNEIAGHLQAGISVANTLAGVRISQNSIHDNGGLGIDLITNGFQTGVTANDPLDSDTGGNGLQNFPVLQTATVAGATLRAIGTLNSSPSSSFAIELFASPVCDASGYGEGQEALGGTTVATDANGNATFDVLLPATVQPGWFVTATATAVASASTSEFSACIAVTGSGAFWGDLGHGIAGTNGVPQLRGSGSLTVGSTIAWSLSGARSAAPAWYVVGLHQALLPIGGGILVPAIDGVLLVTTNGVGAASVALQLPLPLPAGQEISVQVCVLDPAAPLGWAASNAIAGVAP